VPKGECASTCGLGPRCRGQPRRARVLLLRRFRRGRDKPGFREFPDGFRIDPMMLNVEYDNPSRGHGTKLGSSGTPTLNYSRVDRR
jgi:hypothetical protein